MLAAELRELIVDLRLIADEVARRCGGCGGTGRLRSGRDCPICRSARRALESSSRVLLEPLSDEPAVDLIDA